MFEFSAPLSSTIAPPLPSLNRGFSIGFWNLPDLLNCFRDDKFA